MLSFLYLFIVRKKLIFIGKKELYLKNKYPKHCRKFIWNKGDKNIKLGKIFYRTFFNKFKRVY